MKTVRLKFALSSYWRVSSGEGIATIADEVVVRDSLGLPVIPGKTVKGLIREAMEIATLSKAVPPERVVRWFGSPLAGSCSNGGIQALTGDEQEALLEQGRFASREGELWFGTAGLPDTWKAWLRSKEGREQGKAVVDALFCHLASTSIDAQGVAAEHTLRVTEVAVPMELTSLVKGPQVDLAWIDDLKVCLPVLRALGSDRNRGLGRVRVSLEEA